MASSSRGAQGLIAVALIGVLGLAAWYGRFAWADSGPFALVLFGIPLFSAALALWAERALATMLAPAVIAGVAVVSLAWSLVTGLGIGLGFLLPSLLLLVAAMVSAVDRRQTPSSLPH